MLCPWSCPCPWCGSAMDSACSCPSPALRGADACTVHRTAVMTYRTSSRTSSRTCWLRWKAYAALVLAVAVACALPPCALADRAASTTPSTTALVSSGAEDRLGERAWAPALPAARNHHLREMDDYGEDEVEAPRHGQARRLHSSESYEDIILDTSAERRHGSRHRGADASRGPRRQQQLKKKVTVTMDELDDRPPPPPGHTGSCSICREREAIRNWSLDAIKENILHKLNLHHPPNITGRRLPKYDQLADMILDAHPRRGHSGHGGHAHGMLGDDPDAGVFRTGAEIFEEEDDYHARTERVIAFPQTHSNKVRHSYQGQNVLHFRFSQKVMQSQVANATLFVWLRGTGVYRSRDDVDDDDEDLDDDEEDEDPAPSVTVSVMRMRARGSATPDAPVPFELEATTKLEQPEGAGVWVKVDIKKMAEDWFRRPRDNLGLMVYANPSTGADGKLLVNTDTDGEANPNMPFVELYLKDGRKRRVRRSTGLNCDENSGEVRCCRYPLEVDFERFGWDFIIFPKKYVANYCSGDCPYVYMQKYPHTAITHMARNKTGPCCAPRKMSAINMLYFDHDLNVVFGVLPGMVVERCGCF